MANGENPSSTNAITPVSSVSSNNATSVATLATTAASKSAQVDPEVEPKDTVEIGSDASKDTQATTQAGQSGTPEETKGTKATDQTKKKDEVEDPEKKKKEEEEKLKELEQKIEDLKKKIMEDAKNGDMKALEEDLKQLEGLEQEKQALLQAQQPQTNEAKPVPAASSAPAAAAMAPGTFGGTPYVPQIPMTPGGSSSPAGVINGPVVPFNGKTVKPLDNYTVTSEFGPRNDPITGKASFHSGIDLAAPSGTPIKAVADGTVTKIQSDPDGYGNWVEIKHADGSTTRYAHMSAFGNIKVGQEVGAGSIIGAVGSTGHSTGPHLHFEWRDANGNAMNPRQRMEL
jgi:murein DD-endopeptidase MepM/ murein hydrolase activator NlpD